MPFGDFTWGSCQYDTAADFYHEVVGTKRTIGKKLDNKGITVTWTRLRTWKEIKKIAQKYFDREYFNNKDVDYWTPEELKEWEQNLSNTKSIDELFEFCKSIAWDLWSAAPLIATWAFVGLKLHNISKTKDVRGPAWNQEVQSFNNETAVYCAILHAYFDVNEESFNGFDT